MVVMMLVGLGCLAFGIVLHKAPVLEMTTNFLYEREIVQRRAMTIILASAATLVTDVFLVGFVIVCGQHFGVVIQYRLAKGQLESSRRALNKEETALEEIGTH